jgi:hydrogenase/urease accessory protein HupE
MRKFFSNQSNSWIVFLVFTLAMAWNFAQGAMVPAAARQLVVLESSNFGAGFLLQAKELAATSIALGPTMPPPIDEEVRVALGPTMPPPIDEEVRVASGPTMRPGR